MAVPRLGRRFHDALYHRLSVLTFTLPPLRERGSDIVLLAERFLAQACADYGLPAKTLAPEARTALLAHSWPGNVRELANVVERAVLLAEGDTITAPQLALPPRGTPGQPTDPETEEASERERLMATLRGSRWNVTHAAERLGLSRNTMRYRIQRHGLRPDRPVPRRRRVRAPGETPPAAAPAPPPATVESPGARPIRWDHSWVALIRTAVDGPPDGSPDARRGIDLVVEKVTSFGGRVEDLGPSGLTAAFGLDSTEEPWAPAALATLAVQRAFDGSGERTRMRLALHAGQFPVARGRGVAAISDEAKAEVRVVLDTLLGQAAAGTTMVSEAAARLLSRGFILVPSGSSDSVGGLTHVLAGRRRLVFGPARQMTPFVGRDGELKRLGSTLEELASGRGRVAAIVGDAGLGKSRLLYEFRQRLCDARFRYLVATCESTAAAVPYAPLRDVIREWSGILEADPPDRVSAKLASGLEDLGLSIETALAPLLHLLGIEEAGVGLDRLSPEAVRARLDRLLRELVLAIARQGPVVLVVENLHWVDQASESVLASLAESVPAVPLLLVVTFRPEYSGSFKDQADAVTVILEPLSDAASGSIVEAVVGHAPADRVASRILARAEGNPLFLEELALAAAGEDRSHASEVPIPGTIQGALQARIDRLPEETRRLLQSASVVGRTFSLALLGALWPTDPEPGLLDLCRLGFLRPVTEAIELAYVFKHVLTQEAAYEGLAAVERAALHDAVGQALERRYADRLEEVQDRLAFHFSRTPRTDKALLYLRGLADKAARGHAHAEAIAALEEALHHAARLPTDQQARYRLELVLRLADSLYYLGRLPESLEVLEQRASDVESVSDPGVAARYHWLLGRSARLVGDRERGARSLRRAILEARRAGDPATEGKAYAALAMEGYWSGHPRQGVEDGRRAVTLLEGTAERWSLAHAYWALASNHVFMGEFGHARAALDHAAAVGEAIDDARIRAFVATTHGTIAAFAGEFEAGIDACREGVERSPDELARTQAIGLLGGAYLAKGEAARAIGLLEGSVRHLGQSRSQVRAWFTIWLGEAYLLDGQVERARETLREGLEAAEAVGFRWAVGLTVRALGRVAAAERAFAEAQSRYEQALGTFGVIEAQLELGRTHLALAELAGDRGDPGTAAQHVEAARRLFEALDVPRHLDRAERLGRVLAAR